jgi:hypothetical protein
MQTALDLELAERTVIADTAGKTACIFLAGLSTGPSRSTEESYFVANPALHSYFVSVTSI